MLASIEGQVVWVLVVAAVGLFNWLAKKQNTPPESKAPLPDFTPRAGMPQRDSEEARLRRFMEALGVPVDQKPPAPVTRREAPPVPPTLPQIQPRGSVVASAPFGGRSAPSSSPQLPKAARRSVPPLSQSPKSLGTSTTRVEKMHLPELEVPVVPEFMTTSSHVQAIPFEASHADMRDAYVSTAALGDSSRGIRKLLGSKSDLRAAILLREVLGPPRGLQGQELTPSLL